MTEDTIVAISTTLGESGIGIVRLSGKEAIMIADKIFKAKSNKSLSAVPTFSVHYGYIIDKTNGNVIDEVIVNVMKAPRTYTREDVVEINCHGGIIPLKKVLQLCISAGARLALPGEFTKRAFLNGRIDLAEAEAVIDIIKSKTNESLKAAVLQLKGKLSKEINRISEELKKICSQVEANIEFPEEEVETTDMEKVKNSLNNILQKINDLTDSYEEGRILREGIKTAIIGKPNVGKSSLLNELLEEERAIVTHVPGTTRDIIEESLNIEGIPFIIVDTAGIRHSTDFIEKKGIERAFQSIEEADLILFMVDNSTDLSEEDYRIIEEIRNKNVIVVINKIDLPARLNEKKLNNLFLKEKKVKTSLTALTGIKELRKEMFNAVLKKGGKDTSEVLITNIRHKDLLLKAANSINSAIISIHNNMSEEFITVDLREALDFIGEITGRVSTEDILNKIFSEFCIGK